MPKFKKGNKAGASGRPPKQVPSDAFAVITKLAARGVREKDIARACGMAPNTFSARKVEHPEIQDAIDAGRQLMHDSLVGKLYAQAMRGNTNALIFALKSQFGYRDFGDPLGESRPQIVINLPGSMTAEQYERAVVDGERVVHTSPTEVVRA